MKDWRRASVFPETTVKDTIAVIDKVALQIALVTDETGKLLGTVTDGDIRRGLLNGVSLDAPVKQIYYVSPLTASVEDNPQTIHRIMKEQYIRQLPVVDREGRVVELKTLREILSEEKLRNPIILMAGGLGTRLRPLTDNCPKPLLKIGGKPVLETILEGFAREGFSRFFISVNYKSEMIEEYFEDGSKWGVSIAYLKEKKRLGTAGSIHLLPEKPNLPFIVMNGDLLTRISFKSLLDFHSNNQELGNAQATMCVREYSLQIPYGVIQQQGSRLIRLDEKPVQRFFINGGIYVFQPEIIDMIPADTYFDMTHLFDKMLEQGHKTVVFQIQEYWKDIGHQKDYEVADTDYIDFFEL